MKKFNSITEEAEHIMKICGKEPAYIDEEIKESVKRYLFYNKADGAAICSYCGKTVKISDVQKMNVDIKHNIKGYCPHCHRRVEMKASRISRKKLIDHCRVWYYVKRGRTIYLICKKVMVDFDENLPAINKTWRAIYIFGKEKPRRLVYENRWWCGNLWIEYNPVKYFRETKNFYQISKYDFDFYFDEYLEDMLPGSYLKYLTKELIDKARNKKKDSLYQDIECLDLWARLPAVEVLLKTGFENLVKERIDGVSCGAINWTQTDLRKIFRMDMACIREIKKQKLNLREIEFFRWLRKHNIKISPEIAKKIFHTSGYAIQDELLKLSNPEKAIKYAIRQNKRSPGNELMDYMDYLKECKKLNLDLDRKDIRWPKSLQEAHRVTSEKLMEIEEAALVSDYKKAIAKVIGENYSYQRGKYLIKVAENPAELRREGSSLGHCVGAYDKRVVNGRCIIMLIRKAENPDKPFVTMEITSTGKLVQIRAKSNSDPSEEVKDFAKSWLSLWNKHKEVKSKLNRSADEQVLAAAM